MSEPKCIVRQTMEHDPNLKGNAAELAIAAEASELGLEVYYPLTEHGRTDLVLGIADTLYRVQCKWGARVGEKVQVRLGTSRFTPSRGYVVKTYDRSEIDLVAVYCGELKTSYLLPPDVFEGRSSIWLRTGPPKNGQRASLNWAADYEFQGAVAQLAERSDGIRKVRGSIPLSSTSQAESAPTVETVGAHEFRNHFGYYMEQAAQGTEVLVSKRGWPFVRLLGSGSTLAVEGLEPDEEIR
jgi:prevent-host-death family protein